MASQYVSFEGVASTIIVTSTLKCREILYVINDDMSNDLLINFAYDVNNPESGWIRIKPQEKFYDYPTGIDIISLAYKSSSSTVAFRLLGNNNV